MTVDTALLSTMIVRLIRVLIRVAWSQIHTAETVEMVRMRMKLMILKTSTGHL